MLEYAMYLDDERVPKSKLAPGGRPWVVVRSASEALGYIRIHGMPHYISFDHDLGNENAPTGYDFLKELIVHEVELPEGFDFNVHSANPAGAENIRCLMNTYIMFYRGLCR